MIISGLEIQMLNLNARASGAFSGAGGRGKIQTNTARDFAGILAHERLRAGIAGLSGVAQSAKTSESGQNASKGVGADNGMDCRANAGTFARKDEPLNVAWSVAGAVKDKMSDLNAPFDELLAMINQNEREQKGASNGN